MPKPDALQVPLLRHRRPQLRLIKRQTDNNRVPLPRNILHQQALPRIPDIQHLLPRTVLYLKIESYIIAIPSFQNSPPLPAAKNRRLAGTNTPPQLTGSYSPPQTSGRSIHNKLKSNKKKA